MSVGKALILWTFLLFPVAVAAPPPLVEMQQGMTNARFVPSYSLTARVKAAQSALHLAAPPVLEAFASLTPDALFAANGSHLSFWKPSFVIGTAAGGEAGVNYWGKFQQGHMNVGFRAAGPILLDCRLQSVGLVTYKIYTGENSAPSAQGKMALRNGHFFLLLPAAKEAVSVDLWPTPETQPLGIFGCDLNAVR
jgi:hypothetical protein